MWTRKRCLIFLGALGYNVTGIDLSKVGIDQMNQVAAHKKLPVKGK